MDAVMNNIPLVCTLVGAVGIVFSIILAGIVKAAPAGNEKMQKIAGAIQEGAIAYLNRQMKSMGIAGIIIFAVIFATMGPRPLWVSIGRRGLFYGRLHRHARFRTGQRANRRSRQKRHGCRPLHGFQGRLRNRYDRCRPGPDLRGRLLYATHDVIALVALGFGGSLISIFARLGGGIFTKGADVGADLVGKVEAGIPEDDPRNPATIADNVGDNVGDCAGMAADLFETYAVTAVAAMLIGHLLFPDVPMATSFPLILGAISIIASMIAVLSLSVWEAAIHHGRPVQGHVRLRHHCRYRFLLCLRQVHGRPG
jgi:K(+)-stimulated pyrophosphate-energized sodium pump